MIQDYLLELLEELRLPPRRRRRVLAEVDDHLTCSAAELLDLGLGAADAEREAIRLFGAARPLARELMDQEALQIGRRTAAVCSLLALIFAVIVLGPTGKALAWTGGAFPAGVPVMALGQVALAAGLITVMRAWAAGAGQRAGLVLMLRGGAVGVGAIGLMAAIGIVAAVDSLPHSLHAWSTQDWLALAGMTSATAVGTTVIWQARRRVRLLSGSRALRQSEAPFPAPDAELRRMADIALSRLRRRAPVTAARAERLAIWTGFVAEACSRRLPRLARWLDLRSHPYRFASSLSLSLGLVLAVGHGLSDGGLSAPHPWLGLAAGCLITGVEALIVLTGFLVLGRFLGVRGDPPVAALPPPE